MKHLSQFHYQISGNPSGHKLVFLHGLMGSAANWRRIAQAFEADFEILTFDQRGHGRSFQPPTGYSPQDYALDLKVIMDELGWESCFLVGHSMGGRNALEFAKLFSQRVKALVIEDIGPEASAEATARIERLLNLVPAPFASREAARTFFDLEYPQKIAFHSQPQVIAKFFLANIEAKPDGSQDWRFSKKAIEESMRVGRSEDRWDALRNLKMPVLIVRGEHSDDLPRPVFEKMLATLPSAQGVEIPAAGHWVHFDQPDAFIQVLRDFFHDLPS